MSWTGFVVVTLLALAPLLWRLRPIWLGREPPGPSEPVSARLSALGLYRDQLRDLERDSASGLLEPQEESAARLEIQRRILAADTLAEPKLNTPRGERIRLAMLLILLPVFGGALYLVKGHPSLPAQPHRAALHEVPPEMRVLFGKLERQLATLSPQDPDYVRTCVLLGQVNEAMNHPDDAIRLYRQALAVRFIPELAVQIAELQTRREGHISADSLALYRRALDEAPANAPWRLAVEARIASGEHDQQP